MAHPTDRSPDPTPRTASGPEAVASTPEDLAAEFLALSEAGEAVDRAQYRDRLPESLRADFDTLLAGAGRAERGLPRALARDTLLLGRYLILDEIGSGGMGRVFAAQDLQLQRKVAIKVLAPLDQGNVEREEMFLKESRLLAALQHPNIVAVHEAGRDADLTFIVMDLVDGVALSDVIERARKEVVAGESGSRLSPREGAVLERAIGKSIPPGRSNLIQPRDWYASVARIMLEVARTLESAHAVRVIHRDLKPGNIMLQGGGNPVVLDFGLAGSQDLRAGAVTQRLYGSVAYLAPEQARTQQVGTDPRTDVYQLGLILYELLTLRRAFPGHDIGDVLDRIKNGFLDTPRKKNPAVPRDLEAICMKALELNPERRYASAGTLREDLERYIEGSAPVASRSAHWRSTVRTTRYYAKRHPVVMGLSGMIAAGLAVYLGVKAFPHHPPAMLVASLLPGEHAVEPIPLANGQSVSPGDLLCVTVSAAEPQHLYVLSMFRKQDDRRYFASMKPVLLPDFVEAIRKGERAPARPTYDFEVPGCPNADSCPTLICTYIDPPSSGNKIEGLLVFASPTPRPELEAWLDQLGTRPNGLAEADAMELFNNPPTTRGGPVQGITAEELSRHFSQVRQAVESLDDEFNLPGLMRMRLECPVASVK